MQKMGYGMEQAFWHWYTSMMLADARAFSYASEGLP
jgi:hypothetical protein